jgi:hypothetical protein
MYLAKALIVNDKKNDGFVRNPSAALRFNPALLDKESCLSRKWEKPFQSLTEK